ncbi:uncharacterized protein EV154DRAFT_484228 [Mucor mucedo]|uniref:uncharacterized protein n=1 Tax=Mucor mucedo TaxID=29922 RepID=UPI00221E7176|nr:uncharacterized protein EV154DRAFT_484228 [Mucor mucedo]KAI7888264.1 hypothetical protein EV154DRAFT_484228 [Mucor mucedo]
MLVSSSRNIPLFVGISHDYSRNIIFVCVVIFCPPVFCIPSRLSPLLFAVFAACLNSPICFDLDFFWSPLSIRPIVLLINKKDCDPPCKYIYLFNLVFKGGMTLDFFPTMFLVRMWKNERRAFFFAGA